MSEKKRETIRRLIEDGERNIAHEVERWTNASGNNGGWDRWFETQYPNFAERYNVGQGHAKRSKPKPKTRGIDKNAAQNDYSVPAYSTDDALKAIEDIREPGTSRLFDAYCFADYRGDAADNAGGIAVALGIRTGKVVHVGDVRSRKELSKFWKRLIGKASSVCARIIFGQDHQYGVPKGLLNELGIGGTWREAMKKLFHDGQLGDSARRGEAGEYAREFNKDRRKHDKPEYFWSATKGENYGIPKQSPRPSDPHKFRITEQLDSTGALPFARIGDTGTVGGQTIVGIPNIIDLLESDVGKTVFAWPFDGFLEREGSRQHVLVEVYPSALRPRDIQQSDLNDAIACVNWCMDEDAGNRLFDNLSISAVPDKHRDDVRLEGWYLGCQ